MNDLKNIPADPVERLATLRHEFGEHGGVNMSIEASTTFTVMEAGTMPEIFQGRLGPDDGGCFLYGRHFNPTVYVLGRQLAAMEGAEAGYCASSGLGAISSCSARPRRSRRRLRHTLRRHLRHVERVAAQVRHHHNLRRHQRRRSDCSGLHGKTKVIYAESVSTQHFAWPYHAGGHCAQAQRQARGGQHLHAVVHHAGPPTWWCTP